MIISTTGWDRSLKIFLLTRIFLKLGALLDVRSNQHGEQVNEKPEKRRPPKRTLIMPSAATYRLTNHFAVCSTSEIFVFVKPCSTRQRQAIAHLRATHLKDRHCMRTLSMNCTRWLKWKFGSNAASLHGWHRCEQVKGSMHNQSRGWNPKSSHFNEAY